MIRWEDNGTKYASAYLGRQCVGKICREVDHVQTIPYLGAGSGISYSTDVEAKAGLLNYVATWLAAAGLIRDPSVEPQS